MTLGVEHAVPEGLELSFEQPAFPPSPAPAGSELPPP
jgi:hypothetical protein